MTKTSARYFARECYRLAMTSGIYSMKARDGRATYLPALGIVQIVLPAGQSFEIPVAKSWL